MSDEQDMRESQEPIGECWMDDDGTIHLRLVARGPGLSGQGQLSYKTDNEHYTEILNHVGPLKPGEKKLVPPWD
ncbi:MAG: hypothetical protein K2Z81_00665 [Cyanobacteria bacterium]|nr:hypothetical protein [Cyanobacteriota bacterium]